jgi:hypothetical protein
MTYDYVARVTFQADNDEDAKSVKSSLDALARASYEYAKPEPVVTVFQSYLYNTSAPDMPGGVEVTAEPLPGFDRSNPGFDNPNGLGG